MKVLTFWSRLFSGVIHVVYKNPKFGVFESKLFSAVSLRNAQVAASYSTRRKARGAFLVECGKPLIIKDFELRDLSENEVGIQVVSCGINASDVLMCSGEYKTLKKLPLIPGFEICGEVKQVGKKVKNIHEGDKVVALNKDGLNGFSSFCYVNQEDVWQISSGTSFDRGASFLECYATAIVALNRRAHVKSEDTILVTAAAAGGLGLAIVDTAANVYKAKVIGICSTEDRASLVREKGAFAAIKFDKQVLEHKVKEVTNKQGAKVIIDTAGGYVFEAALKWHVCQDTIDLHNMGFISPTIAATFSLEQVNEALSFIREQKSTGSVILEIE